MWFWVLVIVVAIGYFAWKSAQKQEDQKRRHLSKNGGKSFSSSTQTRYSQAPAKRDRGNDARWILPGDSLELAGYVITAGFVYVADYKPAASDKWSDPSLINVRLPVAERPSRTASDPGYWPTYSGLSAVHRAVYLQWLADGRKTPGVDTYCLFLFFYGLEKRAIDELIARGSWTEELDLISDEVTRLTRLYRDSGSFQAYSRNFLGLLACSKAILTGGRVELRSTLANHWDVPLDVKCGLSQFAAAGEPIPGKWALQWAYSSPSINLRTPARRCRSEFETLFLRTYAQQYEKGMVVHPNKTRISIEYQAASLSISSRPFRLRAELPDITVLKRPTERLRALVEECTDALDEYSRALGRKSSTSLRSYLPALLPQQLLETGVIDAVSRLREWLQESVGKRALLKASARDLISKLEQPILEGPTRKTWELACLLLSKLGFGVEPDPRYGGKTPDLDSVVYIFEDEWTLGKNLSAEFKACAVSLPFAAMVSSTDGVDAAELELISRRFSDLHDAERCRLEARLAVMLESPPSVRSLRSTVSAMSERQREGIAQFLLLVAAADGRITQKEVQVLQKMYSALELPPESVHSDIHKLISGGSATPAKAPVVVRKAQRTSPSYGIPEEAGREAEVIVLDAETIRKKREESESVITLLEGVFSEDEVQEEDEIDDTSEDGQAEEMFDDAHRRLVLELVHAEEIPVERWAEMCRQVGLLPDAAIEAINEAVVEEFEEVLIEKSDPLRVDPETAELVRGLYE